MKQDRIQIFVPGINTFPGRSRNWDGRAVTHTHTNTAFRAEKVEYWCGAISRAFGQSSRAEKLFRTLDYYGDYAQRVLVGHSNGADVILRMLNDWPRFKTIDQLHLVCGATEADFRKNRLNALLRSDKVRHVWVYVAGRDFALKLAKTIPARFLGYGYLGWHGPLNVAPDVKDRVTVVKAAPWNRYGHSDCWSDSEFEATMAHFLQP